MTTLTRWDPFTEVTTLQDAMNQLLAESFVRPTRREGRGGSTWVVPMDLTENEKTYTVKLAVPGLKPEHFDISVHENLLTVRGKTEQQEAQEGTTYHVREWRFGEFSRSVQFPSPIDAEGISANLSEGVLTISVPKSEKAMPKRITVTANA